MRIREIVARNIAWNWAGMVTETIAGFVVAPFLVHRLGVTNYGLWIVIGSLTGYFGLLELGLRGSVGRQLAFHRARNDSEQVNVIAGSALLLYSALALAVIVAIVGVVAAFPVLFNVSPDTLGMARLALLIVGINLAVSFPLQVFDGYLWAAQRFDLLNYVDIPTTLLRIALTFSLVDESTDLLTLSFITLTTTTGSGIAKAILSRRLDKTLRFGVGVGARRAIADLFGYGWWNFLLTLARLTKTQAGPILIGSVLGVAFVTPFSIARRLQDSAYRVLWTATGVLTPVATAFHARLQSKSQQKLFIEGGKYSTSAAIFFAALFACLGKPIIALWMGWQFTDAALLLMILAAGEFLHMTQALTSSIIMATASHRLFAWLSIADALTSVVLMVLLAQRFGLVGACIALALPQALFSGVGTLLYGCRIADVPVKSYVAHAFAPAFATAAIPVVMLAALTYWRLPTTWAQLVTYAIAYTVVYAACASLVLRPISAEEALEKVRSTLYHAKVP